jgi:Response regulator containing a CheY-like receiver domain and an HTH DNA-binding domain
MTPFDPSDRSRRVRVALLDDHELLLDSLSQWIREQEPRFELCVAETTWAGLVHNAGFPVDLVLMDLNLTEPVSIEARVRTCRAAGAKVIVLTALNTDADRERALGAGAVAYLTKSMPAREVMAVARQAMGIEDSASGADASGEPDGRARPKLSSAERMALVLYVEGRTTKQVAVDMNVSYETAKTFLRRAREKYGRVGRPTSTRADLTSRAAEDGYLTSPPTAPDPRPPLR